jgi:hypothetical protein
VSQKGDTHVASGGALSARIKKQTELAIHEADAVLFLTDVVAGLYAYVCSHQVLCCDLPTDQPTDRPTDINGMPLCTIGITPKDREIFSWLRSLDRSRNALASQKCDMFGTTVEISKPNRKPLLERTVLVVNKVDNEYREELVESFKRLGFTAPVSVSAAHNSGMRRVRDKDLHDLHAWAQH